MTPEQSSDLDRWRKQIAVRMDSLEQRLQQNSDTTDRVDRNTSELVAILTSWKGAMKVLDFLGKLAKPLAAILAAIGALIAWRAQK